MQQQRLSLARFITKSSNTMKQVDEIIYDAICADAALMEAIGNRVVSTCFEIPPTDEDNTPLPNIIITFDGFQNLEDTKDDLWEGSDDRVQVGVDVAASSPDEVKQLIRSVRRAVNAYIYQMKEDDEEVPHLESLTSDGIQWDWMKPCYYQRLNYQCTTQSDIEDEQDEE